MLYDRFLSSKRLPEHVEGPPVYGAPNLLSLETRSSTLQIVRPAVHCRYRCSAISNAV